MQDLHGAAEEAIREHSYNENLLLSKINYLNVNQMDDKGNQTEYSEHFKQDIYTETSGVQIPIEIYEGCES